MNEMITFWGLAGLITICSILVITLQNPVSAAVFLVLDLFLLAAVYASQGADFVAAIQIIIYTGAILVLFLFVIMILNLDPEPKDNSKKGLLQHIVLGIVIAGFGFIGYKIFETRAMESTSVSNLSLPDNTNEVAMSLFKNYLWPFEIVSILILLAIVGSIAIAMKRKADTQS